MKTIFKGRNAAGIAILGGLVGYGVSEATVAAWPKGKRHEFETWAERTHLRASDNVVRVPPRPTWLPAPWGGEEDAWGPTPTNIDSVPPGGSS